MSDEKKGGFMSRTNQTVLRTGMGRSNLIHIIKQTMNKDVPVIIIDSKNEFQDRYNDKKERRQ